MEQPREHHLDDLSHGQLRGYVSQKNHGLLHMDIVRHEEKKNAFQQQVFQSQRALENNIGAVKSLYLGNNRGEHFTSQWSNVWLTPNEHMFRDTSFASEVKRREREERTLMFNLER